MNTKNIAIVVLAVATGYLWYRHSKYKKAVEKTATAAELSAIDSLMKA